MADSDMTQQVDVKKLLAEANAIIANIQLKRAKREELQAEREELQAEREAKRAKREDHKKLLAEANDAIIAYIRLKQAEREAREKALAEANSQLKRADTPSSEPFLTTSQWLSAIFIAASLAGF